jgi:hypothetical protein
MYSLEDAMTDAAKAAYVATCMEKKETEVNKWSEDNRYLSVASR